MWKQAGATQQEPLTSPCSCTFLLYIRSVSWYLIWSVLSVELYQVAVKHTSVQLPQSSFWFWVLPTTSRPKSIQTNLTWQKDSIEPVLYSSASNMQLLIGALSEKWITMRALVQLGHVTVPFPARARHRTRRLNHGKSNTCWISEIGEWRFLDSGAGRFEREFGTGKFQNKKCSAILVSSQWIFSSKKSEQRICKDLHQFIALFEEPKVKAHGSCRNLCKYPRFLVYMSAETKQMHLFF